MWKTDSTIFDNIEQAGWQSHNFVNHCCFRFISYTKINEKYMIIFSDMNTPENATKYNDKNENKEPSVDKLREKLAQDYGRRRQGRDYARILKEYNSPPQWYQVTPRACSIYYYDPQYQKLLQQHPPLTRNLPVSLENIFSYCIYSIFHIL